MVFQDGANGAPSCAKCHAIIAGTRVVGFDTGPNLDNIVERAAQRVAGQSAEDYLRASILQPAAFVVPGFRAQMYPFYVQKLTDEQVDDLVTYMLTL